MISVDGLLQGCGMAETMNERLRQARKAAGFSSARSAALRFKWGESTYGAHENGQNDFDEEKAKIYGQAFKVRPAWLLFGEGGTEPDPESSGPTTVPLIGIAGAGPGGEIEFSEGTVPLGSVPAPPNWSIKTVALEVRGNSMRPMAMDGWIAYYDDNPRPLTDDMFGEPCVVWLRDGRCLIKIPFAGREPGTFDLESANTAYETMRDAEVVKAALVTSFIPRRAAKRIAGDTQGQAGV
ncbi:LexA family transcriptional regulator [Methylobacterium fujisawaense]|uniref:LexA family transcriptional regulator n=1 Tax=Methylobacterium fujisawaense TaxID=107400 RepID=UPI002F35BF57